MFFILIFILCVFTKDIALMNEREREGFIRKIGISADDTDESDDDEENGTERHKYNCKKCQVSMVSEKMFCCPVVLSKQFIKNA